MTTDCDVKLVDIFCTPLIVVPSQRAHHILFSMELVHGKLVFALESSWRERTEDFSDDMIVVLDDLYQHTKCRKHFGPPSLKVIWKHCDEVDIRMKKSKLLIFLTNDL